MHTPSSARLARIRAHAVCLLFALTSGGGCGGSNTKTVTAADYNPYGITATGPGVLSVSPIDTSQWFASTPLGSLAPPGHVLPTDHVYIMFVDPWGNQLNVDCRKRAVYAAGSGVVSFIFQTEAAGDTKVDIWMTKTFHYYYDHVLLLPRIQLGTRVSAGDSIGTTTGRCPSFDLGVYDLQATLPGLVNPARYGDGTRYAVSPYKYFTAPLRNFYYSRVRLFEGVPANKDGRTDYGVRGKLVGDWFHSSLPVDAQSSGSSNGWGKTIAFVYDWYASTSPRISIGGTIAGPGLFKVASSDPDPATVSTANGLVAYQLQYVQGSSGPGWLLVQMTADDRIRVEVFPATASKPTAFTSAAQEYVR